MDFIFVHNMIFIDNLNRLQMKMQHPTYDVQSVRKFEEQTKQSNIKIDKQICKKKKKDRYTNLKKFDKALEVFSKSS